MSEPKWEYTVQLHANDTRMYRGIGEQIGWTWAVTRSTTGTDGKSFNQSIVASPEVFETDEEAKRDALVKLSILRCPLERPLDHAIRWILDGE